MVFQPQVASGDQMQFTATGAVTAGVPVVLAGMVLLPVIDGVSGDVVNAKITGAHQLAKKAATAFTEGQPCYWNAVDAEVTDLLGDGDFIGNCVNVGGRTAAATTIWVRMAPDAIAMAQGQRHGYAFFEFNPTANTGQRPIASYLGDVLPDNAIVVRSWYEVLITFTSATDAATLALGVETADVAGILAAVAISAATDWDAGLKEGIQVGTVATYSTKTTAAGQRLQIDVAVEALTAGSLILVTEWVVTG